MSGGVQAARSARLAQEINEAFDSPDGDIPAEDVFASLEAQFAEDTRGRD